MRTGPGGARLPRRERLKKRRRIRDLMMHAEAVGEDTRLVIRYQPDREGGGRRVAIVVSRRCPNAVTRNRIRRRLREIYRTGRDSLPPDGDFLIIAKAGAVEADFTELRESFRRIAEKLDR